jgi:hypothetical protein
VVVWPIPEVRRLQELLAEHVPTSG